MVGTLRWAAPTARAAPCPSSRRRLQTLAACLAMSAHCLQLAEGSPLLTGGLLASLSQAVLLAVEYLGTPAVTPGLCVRQRRLLGIQHHSLQLGAE